MDRRTNMDIEQTIQQRKRENGLVIGTKETLKQQEELDSVIVASNIPHDLRDQLEDELDVDIHEYSGSNKDLGSICGKPFAVATVGIEQPETPVR